MKKAPRPSKVRGAAGQGELFDVPVFCPTLPPPHSKAAHALSDLLQGSITHIDWLRRGLGWRLSAAIKELDYLGWCPDSNMVKVSDWSQPIALYSLPDFAKKTAWAMLVANRHG
jgi:hypothetical protein